MSSLDEIKSRIDIVDLISESVQLRRTGKNYTGFCPFHSNTRTPAFVVFPETGTWRCFGQCNDGGDIFGFVMKKEGWDFSEALRRLAERAGVVLRPPTPAEQAAAEEHEGLRAMLEEAATYFHHNLVNTAEGKSALEYLRQKRGLTGKTIEAFGLGYALNSWEALTNHFMSKGYKQDDLVACGLVSEREGEGGLGDGGVYDRFRNRIMFPIRDDRGRMAGFGARCLDPEDMPKFLNSPQTPIFDKGGLLYGLDRARKSIRSNDRALIVEGYLDVIALHQAGYNNAVSPMGTALTETQLRLLKRFTRRIVLALDADAAGDKATLRGLQIARQALERETDVVFDARGLLGYEARLNADIRVTTLPEGKDPDDVVNENPQEWEQILESAKPIVEHVMRTLVASRDLEDPKAKSEIAAQVLPLIEDIPDPVERETYRQRLARVLRVDERVLLGMRARKGTRRSFRLRVSGDDRTESQPTAQVLSQAAENEPLEMHCLGILLRQPELLYRVDRALQEYQLGRLSTADLRSSDKQIILELIAASLRQDHAEPVYYVLNSLSLPLMELADRLLKGTENLDPNEERVLEDLIRTVLELRRRNLRQNIDHLRFLMEEAQQSGETSLGEYLQTMNQYSEARIRLDKAMGKFTDHVV
ncbi:MAG: DNA primase [Anaerolineales bacterium]|nr:DNA primase [Anaerolineales bacterium]